jgi:hypothetical protein
MAQSAQAFFEEYEKVISDADVSKIAEQYADVFLFGGPQGVQCVKKDDFLKVLPRRKEYFASMGLLSSKVTSVDELNLDATYLLARTRWKMAFRQPNGMKKEIETSATYVLEKRNGKLAIVFQIDHQDLAVKVKDMGSA